MTDVVTTIGTSSRDYSTIQAWEDALPANFVSATERHIGECYNDSEFSDSTSFGVLVTFAGSTTDATYYPILRAASGEGFADHADAATNPLIYDQTKGVGIRHSGIYSKVMNISTGNVVLEGLQVINSGGGNNNTGIEQGGNNGDFTVDKCIVYVTSGAGFNSNVIYSLVTGTKATKVSNTVLITGSTTNNGIRMPYNTANTILSNVTIVRTSNRSAAGFGIHLSNAASTFRNVIVCGFASTINQTSGPTIETCLTDLTAPESGWTQITYADQFESTTADFRLKSGADAIDAGTTDTTYSATDIIGTSRPQGSSYDIGAWEFASGASSALTGTATASITEADIVTGGKTIILTLTGDTWVTAGATFDAIRQDIIDGIDSAQAEAAGWDAEVKANQGVSGVVRTSDTVCTITLDAQAAYDITATETVTATIPGSALTGGSPIVASPTFAITANTVVTGTAAWTEDDDTLSAQGEQAITGSSSINEAEDMSIISGDVVVSGTAAWSESDDTIAIDSLVGMYGSTSWTESNDTMSSSGQSGDNISGGSAWSEDSDTLISSGLGGLRGPSSWQEDDDSISAQGVGGEGVSGASDYILLRRRRRM